MTEIRVKDLRFSLRETAEFLQQMLGTTIEESTVSTFAEKSEGWITGLRLATLTLRHTDNIERVVVGLPGGRFISIVVVCTVFLSLVAHGLSANPLAKWLAEGYSSNLII